MFFSGIQKSQAVPSLAYRNLFPLVRSLGAKWQIQKSEGLTKGRPEEVTAVVLLHIRCTSLAPASFVTESLKATALPSRHHLKEGLWPTPGAALEMSTFYTSEQILLLLD